MITTKPVNLTQLQGEALALKQGHACFNVVGGKLDPKMPDVIPAGADLMCMSVDGSVDDKHRFPEPCPAAMTAYKAHVAMRSQTREEVIAIFQASIDPVTKQLCRDKLMGLVPMDQIKVGAA